MPSTGPSTVFNSGALIPEIISFSHKALVNYDMNITPL